MPDSVDSLHSQILDAAIEWADHVEAEGKLDERPPKRESNVILRQGAAQRLQTIRELVKDLHNLERSERVKYYASVIEPETIPFCSIHNTWHKFGVTCE